MKMRIHRAGWGVIPIVFLLFALISWALLIFTTTWVAWSLIVVGIITWIWVISFFRVPSRLMPKLSEEDILCPADGKIVVIERIPNFSITGQAAIQISIFMNIYNVHRNVFPVSGILTEKKYSKGHHKLAKQAKASELNEQCTSVIKAENGDVIAVRQIAGAMARRVITYATTGKAYKAGDELGFIRFGSRVDVILPDHYEIVVKIDDKVKSGLDILARYKK